MLYEVITIPIKSDGNDGEIIAAGSTEKARKKIQESGIKILQHGTIPGIPGILLNEGRITSYNVCYTKLLRF